MLKVAFFMNRFPMASETFIMNSAAGLVDAGHDVHLYGLSGAGPPGATHALVEQRGLLARSFPPRLTQAGTRGRWIGAPGAFVRAARASGLRFAASGLNLATHRRRGLEMRAMHEVEAFRHRGRYDALHCHFGTLAEPVLRHRRAGGLSGPVIVHFRGYDISSHVAKHGADYYARTFREADAFIANSAFFRDRAIALGCPADRISVVESPVNLDVFPFRDNEPPSDEGFRLLTVGRLVEKKGIAYAIEAVARLRSRGHAIRYRIIGEGSERAVLERAIADHQLEDVVSLLGERSQEAIASELAEAHVFIAPSVHGSNGSADAAVNVLKEAMACGVPVVSTWHGGIPELVEDGVSGLLAPERDADALADRLQHLFDDGALRARLGAVGRRAVENRFALPFITHQLLDIYHRAAQHNGMHDRR